MMNKKTKDVGTNTATKPIPKAPKMQFYKRQLPEQCIPFSSESGKKLFKEAMLSGYANVYFQLAEQFCTQAEPAYCGLTTLTMVLNTLAVDPKRLWRGGWRWYNEEMLDCCLSLDVVQQKGITMEQFIFLATCNNLDLNVIRVSDRESIHAFREAIKKICSGSGNVLVTSYSRAHFGQTGDGHFSPIGAYHERDDKILIFDVARYKYPPHWVSLESMWGAMKLLDKTTEKPRGYIVMRKTEEMPLILFRLSSSFRVTIATHNFLHSCMARFLISWKRFLKEAKTCGFHCDVSFENTLTCLLEALNEALSSLIDGEFVFTTQFDICCTEALTDDHIEAVSCLLRAIEGTDVYKSTEKWVTEFRKKNDADVPKAECEGNNAGCSKISCISRLGKSITDIEDADTGLSNELKCINSNWSQGKRACKESCKRYKPSPKKFLTESHYITMFFFSWPYHMEGESTHISTLSRYVGDILQSCDQILRNEATMLRKQIESLAQMVGEYDIS